MENNPMHNAFSIVASATITNKEENQDSCLVLEDPFKAILVADGLGGHEYAKYAKRSSERVVNFFKDHVLKAGSQMSAGLLEELFHLAKTDMLDYAIELDLSSELSHNGDFLGTTAITLFENKD